MAGTQGNTRIKNQKRNRQVGTWAIPIQRGHRTPTPRAKVDGQETIQSRTDFQAGGLVTI